jgi:hypothetical protein
MKVELVERDGFKCKICGKFLTSCREARRFVKLGQGLYHIDHIVPVVQGGRATLENLRLTCPECNLKRKKRFTFKEILDFDASCDFAANCGEQRQDSAIIQSNPNPNPNPIQNDARKAREEAFEKFWSAYPRKEGKQKAKAAFEKVNIPLDVLLNAIEQQKESAQWSKDNGQFIPHPTTWLNGKRWEDEVIMAGNAQVGASGRLGEAERAAIQRLLAESEGA